MPRRELDVDVLTAATERVRESFDLFGRICVSFSGGKDSTVLLHLVAAEARRRQRRIGVLFIDWEAQYALTISHVEECLSLYTDVIDPFWCCVPLRTTNAVSQIEPEWTCWEEAKRPVWVRGIPPGAKTASDLPFVRGTMTFEEFVPAFAEWYSGGTPTGFFVGIRTGESKDRWLAIVAKHKHALGGRIWTTMVSENSASLYPLYDWRTEDVWTYLGKTGLPYNRLYDRMYAAGVPLGTMRICEPYGDEQRKGLWLFHVLEPESWGRILARVAGANSGALYSKDRGNVLGNREITRPPGMTWQQFAALLLDTMPAATSTHYSNKIAVWRHFYEAKGVTIEDTLPTDSQHDGPSWRRVCRTILRNDYWCHGIGFVPTKTAAYDRYLALMKDRRAAWGLQRPADSGERSAQREPAAEADAPAAGEGGVPGG